MRWRLTPARRRGLEILDDRATPDEIRGLSMADIVRSNRLLGGAQVALRAFRSVVAQLPRDALMLDVGTGLGDIPSYARREAAACGVSLSIVGLDISEFVVRRARSASEGGLSGGGGSGGSGGGGGSGDGGGAIVGDVLRLPLADGCADVVVCSQLLHHFADGEARQVIAELHRVSRGWVLLSDLRRSWLAAAGFAVASVALRFHAVTRHDGVVSVLRGFTAEELETLVATVTGSRPRVTRGVFWRLSAVWHKSLRPIA